jgi:hypothetical protein
MPGSFIPGADSGVSQLQSSDLVPETLADIRLESR